MFIYRLIRSAVRRHRGQSQADPASKASATDDVGPKISKKYMVALFFGLGIPVLLETLDYTVVATAQTHIASAFNRLDLQSYIGTTYLLTSTVFLPFFATLADIYGRHAALQISLVFFLFGSAISTGGRSMAMVLAGRGIAGIGAAGLTTCVRVILADTSSINQNNTQTSILMLLYAIGYTVGPYIGGAIVTANWRWIFGINLPAAALAMVFAFFLLRKYIQGALPDTDDAYLSYQSRPMRALNKLRRIDWLGTALFTAGGILVLLALNWGSNQVWNSAKVIAGFVVGGVLLIICAAWQYILESKAESDIEKRSSQHTWPNPLIPLAVFRSYDICAAQYVSYICGMVMLVIFYFVAIFMIIVAGKSPASSGVQLLYFAPGTGVGVFISRRLTFRLRQPKYAVMAGSLLTPIALGMLAYGIDQNKQGLIDGFMVVTGVGVGLSTPAIAVQARFSMPSDRVAIVAALTLFFRSLGGTVGLAQCAAVMSGKVSSDLRKLYTSGVLSDSDAAALAALASSGGLSSIQGLDSLPSDVQVLVRNAFRDGVRWSFLSMVPWAAIAFVLSLWLSDIDDTDNPKAGTSETAAGGGEGDVEMQGVKDSPDDDRLDVPQEPRRRGSDV